VYPCVRRAPVEFVNFIFKHGVVCGIPVKVNSAITVNPYFKVFFAADLQRGLRFRIFDFYFLPVINKGDKHDKN
jgi:hypothetical protein